MIPIETVVLRAGQDAVRITPLQNTGRWSSAAVGGFAAASFNLPGDQRKLVPHFAKVQLQIDGRVLWEGQIEDVDVTYGEEITTAVQAFGFRRRLEQTSIQRTWLKRDIGWQAVSSLTGTLSGVGLTYDPQTFNTLSVGQFDDTDPTRAGVKVRATSNLTASLGAAFGTVFYTGGGTLTRIMFRSQAAPLNDNNITVRGVRDSTDGTTWNTVFAVANSTAAANTDQALTSGAKYVQLLIQYTTAPAGANAGVEFENIRLLGTTVTEDVAGGMYGGAILRDLIALVPGLQIGQIDTGSDFAIEQMDRSARESALSVFDEVQTFYAREWQVWEEGRVDWRAPNLDEPGWLTRVGDAVSLELNTSVDSVVRTVYVQYLDATSFVNREATATSTDQRNPAVKAGLTKDAVVNVSFLMTPNTAAQLATRLATDQGSYPPVSGKIVLPASRLIQRSTGVPMPAYGIRAGENILVYDLPKSEPFVSGRDGETLFHIVGADTDLESGLVELQLEGQMRQSDVLLARLAATTRTITG